MALLAKTKNTIEKIGRRIPIPFSETVVSPDKFSDRYTNNPSKIKFNMMLSRPITNWDFLFLNINIAIKDNNAEPQNKAKYSISSLAKKETPSLFIHKSNTKINPAEIPAAIKRYMVWILWSIISKKWRTKIMVSF